MTGANTRRTDIDEQEGSAVAAKNNGTGSGTKGGGSNGGSGAANGANSAGEAPEQAAGTAADGSAGSAGSAEPAGNAEAELSYEQARDELDSVVRRLEAGGLTLKESLALWERGERLAATCERWLEGARAKLAVAMEERDQGGSADSETPF
ncbi:hypothetical protein GCM10027570_49050 [Streptomonospora sediminis]